MTNQTAPQTKAGTKPRRKYRCQRVTIYIPRAAPQPARDTSPRNPLFDDPLWDAFLTALARDMVNEDLAASKTQSTQD
jgi:hypothetical protein